MDTYSLLFENSNGVTREIAQISALDASGSRISDKDILSEAHRVINGFCAERNFKIWYARLWNNSGRTTFDVGSHTEFFHLSPAVNISN